MKPETRKEAYLAAIGGQDVDVPAKPITREEAYLAAILENGAGGGGTNNYNALRNKPKVNDIELSGNKSLDDLGIQKKLTAGDNINIDEDGVISASGSGTSDYTNLTNKPSINSVTLSGNKTSADLGLQDAIQIDTMPTASATYDGKIVQFTGTTTASYTHGYYYECINNGGTYAWTQTNVQPSSGGGTSDYTQLSNKPSINSVTLSGNKTTADLGLQDAIQLATMPTAGATYVGKVVQFVGTTDANYTHGYFYECTTDGSTYSWTQTNVQPSSGSGGGHTIVNGAGTSMTQRDALQFTGGLAVSDDSTNERTVVSDEYELILWEDWQTIVANHEENLHPDAIITGVPDADGDISVDLMTKLWENPSPSSDFAGQTLNVDLSGYDFFAVETPDGTVWGSKSNRAIAELVGSVSSANYIFRRTFTVSGQTLVVSNVYRVKVSDGTDSYASNNYCIPIRIYGIKTTASVKVSAIAENVSTSADKCMLSDGVTSVEEALECTQTTAGNYRLRATVGAGGAVTYSWVAE